MNLLITTRCKKNCSFCFAKNIQDKYQDITLDKFNNFLDFLKRSEKTPFFQIMGGEPTEHLLFVEFIKEINKRKIKFNLITNLQYSNSDINDILKTSLENGLLSGVLCNAAELANNSLPNFTNNYNYFYKLTNSYPDFLLSCGITLNRNKAEEEELAYIKELINKIKILNFRISQDIAEETKEDLHFINNKTLGNKIINITNLMHMNNIPIFADCVFYPCLFSDQYTFKRYQHLINNFHSICDSSILPIDIFPDLSFCHGLCSQEFRGKNILDYKNTNELIKEMIFRKKILNHTKKIPDQCLGCYYFENKICNSLCIGSAKLESPLLEIERATKK